MPRTAGFWSWYAKTMDELRSTHEESWFGEPVTKKINEQDMPALSGGYEEPPEPQSAPQEAGQETEPSTSHEAELEAVYGQKMEQEQEQEL